MCQWECGGDRGCLNAFECPSSPFLHPLLLRRPPKRHLSLRVLDEGLGLAFVHLDVDLGIFVLLVPDALEAAAVAQQVEGQAESHHAQRQQTHVHLKGKLPGSVWYRCMRLKYPIYPKISHP